MHPASAPLLFVILLLVPAALARWYTRWKRTQLCFEVVDTLAFLSSRGLPLGGGLKTLAREWGGGRGERVSALASDLADGGSLGRAMQEQPRLFPPALTGIILAGEQAGGLPAALAVARRDLDASLGGASSKFGRVFYPLLLVAIVFLAVFFAEEILRPRFMEIGESLGLEFGSPPEAIPFLILEGALIFVLVLVGVGQHGAVGSRFTRLLRRIPPARGYVRARDQARWLQRVAALVEAGVSVHAAFASVAELTDDAGALREATSRAESGEPLEQVLAAAFGGDAARRVPRVLVSVQAHGLPEGLRATAERLLLQAERRLGILGSLLDPLPTLLCGLVIGSLAIGVFGWITSYHRFLLDQIREAW